MISSKPTGCSGTPLSTAIPSTVASGAYAPNALRTAANFGSLTEPTLTRLMFDSGFIVQISSRRGGPLEKCLEKIPERRIDFSRRVE